MKAPETVQAAFVRAFFFEALALGFDRQRLTQRSGFDPDAWPNPDARLPYAIYLRLWQAVRDLANDPAFALKLGELVDPQQMGILGSMILSSPTLREVARLFLFSGEESAVHLTSSPNLAFKRDAAKARRPLTLRWAS